VAIESEVLQTVNIPEMCVAESHFGADDDESNMRELQDRTGKESILHVLPANGETNVPGDFDACNEYGYRYSERGNDDEEEDEEGDTVSHHPRIENGNQVPDLSMDVSPVSHALYESYVIYLLGKSYDPIHDYAPRRTDESSLFWFTYRINFPEIVPYRITTDAGWGCMLRSAQMMLAQAIRMHYKGRTWRPPNTIAQRKHDPFVVKILNWFADFPSKSDCVFSLHNMVAAGLSKYETLPGEWYGPMKASYVMRDLCHLYEEREAKEGLQGNSSVNRPFFRVHVASQGTVYRDAVNVLMTNGAEPRHGDKVKNLEHPAEPVSHPLDPKYDAAANPDSCRNALPWDTSLLLLVPLRLGLQNFNDDYALQLAHIFSLKHSVGLLGGRPRGARWFYGATSDANKLYGLDPHTIQACPERRTVNLPKGQTKSIISLTDDYIRSVHTTNPECIDLRKLDPSLAFGFYCRDRDEFDCLCISLQEWKDAHPSMPEMFTLSDQVPDYSANASAMSELVMSLSVSEVAFTEQDELQGNDEDDYVLL
jgi:cysteine protease ATG4